MEVFKLKKEDYFLIETAAKTARRLLRNPGIKPRQIIGLGNAMYALERLPETTKGVNVKFGIVYDLGNQYLNEKRNVVFTIDEDKFCAAMNRSTYDREGGSVNLTELDWNVCTDGHVEEYGDIFYLEDHIKELLHLGGEIFVDDDSDIEYKDEDQ
ncbi:hypothetical protein SAMN02745751_01869 [Dethiosulfatibacter aminovorans DSM 17477]|uniref:Uncharacterized protein n=1 Tax=Dethiosulfatibacter aminovorans DSM 17477 TaxID=1121476 RepID=A0A1M6H0C6_9FIRM|nr:hypothetical protein [Dethiosulfatibacter aminovorans]SHJ15621.1 hypothetical protein SAMN02745751_01869 [Dethiosulfatibacter aminovorans DSM 17477]